jgi:hypothetical protein
MIGWSKMTEKLLDMTLKEMLFRCILEYTRFENVSLKIITVNIAT